jgi:CheY-like chemotaxis protein
MALGVYSVLYDFGHLIGTGIGWWSSIMKGRVWWPGRADLAESSNFPVVLLVEDEWLIRADMAAGLEEAGWEVVEASTGEGAIEQLCNGLDIDLLVTDIQLADNLSGWDVAETARQVRPDFAVIYTSGNHRNPSRQVEDSVFLSKPCDCSQLIEAGKKLIPFGRSK